MQDMEYQATFLATVSPCVLSDFKITYVYTAQCLSIQGAHRFTRFTSRNYLLSGLFAAKGSK